MDETLPTPYTDAMRDGAEQYRDITDLLAAHGHAAYFTQTGGMCAALVIPRPDGGEILITDEEDTLSWNRADHQGWAVGIYDAARDDLAYITTKDSTPEALLIALSAAIAKLN